MNLLQFKGLQVERAIENIYSVCPLPNKRICESPGCDGSYACKTYQTHFMQ